jgi:Integrase zinc binding domain
MQYTRFLRYCAEFFVASNKLWRKNAQGHHKLVLFPELCLSTLRSAHDNLGHKGFYATRVLITERFWWPQLSRDVIWFVCTCHLCQIRQTRAILIPPTVAIPAPLFAKMYMDSMHMPPAGGFRYIAQGRCSLTHYPEF